jgi:hypothetical protein
MSKKDITYKRFQTYVKDKDRSVNHLIDNYLTKTQSMFRYTGLPDTIPSDELEHILQTSGKVFVTRVDGELYALRGELGGELDAYERPTKYTVANVALNLSKTFDVFTDGVLMKNDYNTTGLLPLLGKYAVLLTDSTISLNTASVLTRITMLISASDDKTKQSADMFLQKILDGDFSIIGENAFFKGVQLQTSPTSNSVYVTQLVELVQYFKASLLNELGLNANYNMKRERLTNGETAMNVDCLLPFVDNMLTERRQAVEKINTMFGTDITVDLSSSWRINHEEQEQHRQAVETNDPNDIDDTDREVDDTDREVDDTDSDKSEIGDTDETTETDKDEDEPLKTDEDEV